MGNITKHGVFCVSWISPDIPTHWVKGILLLLCLCVCILFNNFISCKYDIMRVIEQWMNVEHWWHHTDRHTASVRGIPVLVPVCPTQIPHRMTWDWPWASVMTGCWLTIWAMAGPIHLLNFGERHNFLQFHYVQIAVDVFWLPSLYPVLLWRICDLT